MSKFINIGDTIEAEHANACVRKLEWKGPRKHPITNECMMLYESNRNSNVEIVKVYAGEIKKGTEHFHRNMGDILEADSISIYVDSTRREKSDVKEGVSARHGAQLIDIRKRSISTIKYPLHNLFKCLGLGSSVDIVKTIK
ncbi:hypothetical protein AGMMS49525_02110 [Bacteroidia bacterium]|nr:hypothetical protein AGMMS49525_02110 [Bacteroidia bacterium]